MWYQTIRQNRGDTTDIFWKLYFLLYSELWPSSYFVWIISLQTWIDIYRTLYSLISNLILNIQTGNSRTKDTSYMIFHYIYSKAKNRRKHKSSPFEKTYKWILLSNCDFLLFSICILHPTSQKCSFFNRRKFWESIEGATETVSIKQTVFEKVLHKNICKFAWYWS